MWCMYVIFDLNISKYVVHVYENWRFEFYGGSKGNVCLKPMLPSNTKGRRSEIHHRDLDCSRII